MKIIAVLLGLCLNASLLFAQSLPASLSSAAAPQATPAPQIPLVFAYKDTTNGLGPIYCGTQFPVAVGDSLTFGLNGASVPSTVIVFINGVAFGTVAVPTATVTVNGIAFHVLGALTADVAGKWTLTVSAPGYAANPITVTAQ